MGFPRIGCTRGVMAPGFSHARDSCRPGEWPGPAANRVTDPLHSAPCQRVGSPAWLPDHADGLHSGVRAGWTRRGLHVHDLAHRTPASGLDSAGIGSRTPSGMAPQRSAAWSGSGSACPALESTSDVASISVAHRSVGCRGAARERSTADRGRGEWAIGPGVVAWRANWGGPDGRWTRAVMFAMAMRWWMRNCSCSCCPRDSVRASDWGNRARPDEIPSPHRIMNPDVRQVADDPRRSHGEDEAYSPRSGRDSGFESAARWDVRTPRRTPR